MSRPRLRQSEALGDDLAEHAWAEVCAQRDLRVHSRAMRSLPAQLRAGVLAGRLEVRRIPRQGGVSFFSAHRVHRRLAYRSMPGRGNGAASLLTLRHPDLEIVRLPYA